MSLLGVIDGLRALAVVERSPWPTSTAFLGALLPRGMTRVQNLGANDIYSWNLAQLGRKGVEVEGIGGGSESESEDDEKQDKGNTANGEQDKGNDGDSEQDKDNNGDDFIADAKVNLIYPCSNAHVAKYSRQRVRVVTETPAVYRDAVHPFMERKRDEGRLNWVFNIIEGKEEMADVIYRTPLGQAGDEGFLLLPDLNWDRSTLDALHLLAIVERRDMWSLRDLRKKHVPWLDHMRAKLISATVAAYPSVEPDQLKFYVHYQPTYYHLHIHIVHVDLEAGATQATGKAVALDSIVETLRAMQGDDDAGMDRLTMTYTLGETSELWISVLGPFKHAHDADQ